MDRLYPRTCIPHFPIGINDVSPGTEYTLGLPEYHPSDDKRLYYYIHGWSLSHLISHTLLTNTVRTSSGAINTRGLVRQFRPPPLFHRMLRHLHCRKHRHRTPNPLCGVASTTNAPSSGVQRNNRTFGCRSGRYYYIRREGKDDGLRQLWHFFRTRVWSYNWRDSCAIYGVASYILVSGHIWFHPSGDRRPSLPGDMPSSGG